MQWYHIGGNNARIFSICDPRKVPFCALCKDVVRLLCRSWRLCWSPLHSSTSWNSKHAGDFYLLRSRAGCRNSSRMQSLRPGSLCKPEVSLSFSLSSNKSPSHGSYHLQLMKTIALLMFRTFGPLGVSQSCDVPNSRGISRAQGSTPGDSCPAVSSTRNTGSEARMPLSE